MKLYKLLPLTALVMLSACASQQAGKQTKKPEHSSLERYLQANRYSKAMKISGIVKIKGSKGWSSSSASLLFERPDNFRLTFHNPMGSVWFLAVANAETISLLIPADNVKEIIDRKKKQIIKIGPLKISPEDFLRIIHPGLEKEWVEKGYLGHSKREIQVSSGDAIYRFKLDTSGKIKVASIERKGGSVLIARYQYTENNGVIVVIGDFLKFEMQNLKAVNSLPPALFASLKR